MLICLGDIFMRLCHIIEGIGFGPDSTNAFGTPPIGILSAKTPADFRNLFAGRPIRITTEDGVGDVIKLEPANHNVPISTLTSEPSSLYKGKIYYGFKTVSGDEYESEELEALLRPLENAQKFGGNTIGRARAIVKELKNPTPHSGYEQDLEGAQELQDAIDIASHVCKNLNKTRTTENDITFIQAIKLLKQSIGTPAAKEAAYHIAQYLKSTTGSVTSGFIDMCMEQLSKLPGVEACDYVVAPESSSQFNQALAARIKQDAGLFAGKGKADFLQIGKLMGRDVTVSRPQLEAEAKRRARTALKNGLYKVTDPDTRESITVKTEKEYIDKWSTNEFKKLEALVATLQSGKAADRPAKIKAQQALDKRRYVKIFDKTGAAPVAGKSVLIIDDNIVGGSTIDLVHEIVDSVGPRKIDVFIPLWIPDYI